MQRGQVLALILIGVVILIILAGSAFYLGRITTLKSKASKLVINNYITQSPSPKLERDERRVKDITVSFAEINSKIYLRYKGKIYDQDKNFEPQLVTLQNSDSYDWHGVVDTDYNYTGDEVFSFKVTPDNKSFIFVMRSDYLGSGGNTPKPGEKFYSIFYYDNSKPSSYKVANDLFFSPSNSSKYIVPKIDQFSQDGKYASIDMFSCWNCVGHQQEKLLYNLKTGASKSIGKVSYFVWKDDGAYEYKDYVEIVCKTAGSSSCSEDPKNLLLKTAQF